MYSEFITDIASWALSAEKLKAHIASENIASMHTKGKVLSVDFSESIGLLKKGIAQGDKSLLIQSLDTRANIKENSVSSLFESAPLDEQVTHLSMAQGKYRVIAESLNRKLGLMRLASRGQ